MHPMPFKEANHQLSSPVNWDIDLYGPCGILPTVKLGSEYISLWKLNFIERLRVLFKGEISVTLMSSSGHPPIVLDVNRKLTSTSQGK